MPSWKKIGIETTMQNISTVLSQIQKVENAVIQSGKKINQTNQKLLDDNQKRLDSFTKLSQKQQQTAQKQIDSVTRIRLAELENYKQFLILEQKKIDLKMQTEKVAVKAAQKQEKEEKEAAKKAETAWADAFETIGNGFKNLENMSGRAWGQMGADVLALIKGGAKGSGLSAIPGILDTISSKLTGLSGNFRALSGVGGMLGGIIGTLVSPGIGTLLGGSIGTLIGSALGSILNIPNQIFGVLKSIATGIFNLFGNIIKGIGGIGKGLKDLIFGPVSLFGLGFRDVLRSIQTGLSQTINEVFDAAVAFQQLSISIETLISREVARQEQTEISLLDQQKLTQQTEALWSWLKKVSLTSPFTMQSITKAIKFASAMGLSIKTTEDLTLATGNFAAAMAIGEDHQERIMYNLAQIYQQGKLTGREFRDLAISFVPVYDILGEMASEVGMTTEAFKKLALEGGVPVEDFFEHFIGYMNKNFPDAMKKMSRTWYGVKNNIKDFIEVVLGMEVLGPVLDEISGKVADILDSLLSAQTHGVAKNFGEVLRRGFLALADGFNQLWYYTKNLIALFGIAKPSAEGLAQAFVKLYLSAKWAMILLGRIINTVAYAIGRYLLPTIKEIGGLDKQSGSWGVNLMKQFAIGIMKGAGRYLALAILYVRALIKAFFKPSSPPKVAPDIDEYGAETMAEWINGMVQGAKAGMQQVTQIGDDVTDALDVGVNLAINGKINAEDVVPDTTSVTQAVNQFIPFITEEGMRIAVAFMKGFTTVDYDILDSIQSQLSSVFDVLEGLQIIPEGGGLEMFYNFSQDMIAAIDEFNKTGVISQKLLEEIGALGMGLGPELADFVIQEFNLADAIKKAEEAQRRLDKAIEDLGKSRKTVRTLVDQYNQLLRAGASKETLKYKLAELNTAEKAVTQGKKEVTAAEKNKELADARVELLRTQADLQNKLLDNMIELLNTQAQAIKNIDEASGSMSDALDDFKQQINDVQSDVEDWTPWDIEGWEKDFEPAIEEFATLLADTFGQSFQDTIENIDNQNAANTFAMNLKNAIINAIGIHFNEPLIQGKYTGGNLMGEGIVDPKNYGSIGQQLLAKIKSIFEGITWTDITDFIKGQFGTIFAAVIVFITAGPGWFILLGGIRLLGDKLKYAIIETLSNITIGDKWKPFGYMEWYLPIDVKPDVTLKSDTTWWDKLTDTEKQEFIAAGGIPPVKVDVPVTPQIDMQNIIGPTVDFNAMSEAVQNYVLQNQLTTWGGATILNLPLTVTPTITSDPTIPDAINATILNATNLDFLTASGKVITDTMLDSAYTQSTSTGWFSGDKDMATSISTEVDKQINAVNNLAILEGLGQVIPDTMLNYANDTAVPNWFTGTNFGAGIGANIQSQVEQQSNVDLYRGAGTSMATSVGEGLDSVTSISNLGNSLWNLLKGAIDWLRDKLGWHSPIPLFVDMGKAITGSIAEGITQGSASIGYSLNNAIRNASNSINPYSYLESAYSKRIAGPRYTSRQMVSAPAVSRVSNVNFGDVYIRDNMDWATFKSRVHRAITEG